MSELISVFIIVYETDAESTDPYGVYCWHPHYSLDAPLRTLEILMQSHK
jgi:hypothetical protein